MENPIKKLEDLTPLQRALIGMKEMRVKLEALKKEKEEPIAIIGMACRFPGNANTLEEFWGNLITGFDAVTEIPKERWDVNAYYDANPDAKGKMITRWGSFLKNIDLFDAPFFGISPREATMIDPQHRLLLEVCWDALENAGQVPSSLENSQTGVFIGLSNADYLSLLHDVLEVEAINAYAGTGNASSVAAGRLAYFLGLQGPNMVIDTACSSSLVSVHLACQSLRNKECNMALAGGVNLTLSPISSVYFSQLRALSKVGRCKTFDRDADGYVRGEGCGLVVLKRLSDAIDSGDEILALVSGSAVNHDGKSSGLTVPNGLSQQKVIKKALGNAGVRPNEVNYVEMHGSGTPLGDPIEVNSLTAVLRENRPPSDLLRIGSVKTNLGHLESAAGIAGLIKVVLSLKKEKIPPHLNFKEPNPYIDWSSLPIVVNTKPYDWPPSEKKRIAGISAFGFSGTNAHLIIEEAPKQEVKSGNFLPGQELLLPLSAHSPEALDAVIDNYNNLCAKNRGNNSNLLHSICYTAAVRRHHHNYRLVLRGDSFQAIESFLQAAGKQADHPNTTKGRKRPNALPKVVFVFSGQGTEWIGMGRELMQKEPIFRSAIEACAHEIGRHVDWSPLELLTKSDDPQLLEEVDVLQPLLFAIQVSLATLWKSWGILPDAVIGYSMGEVAAAHLCSALDLENAARLICTRSKVLKTLKGQGAMAIVELSLEKTREVLEGFETNISIAASTSPTITVVSGEPEALAELLEKLRKQGVFSLVRKENIAAHSAQLDAVAASLPQKLQSLKFLQPKIPIYLTVTAKNAINQELDAEYWAKNLRMPVLFAPAIQQLLLDGYNTFIEISPNPGLLSSLQEILHFYEKKGLILPSIKKKKGESTTMYTSLSALYCAGAKVEWASLFPTGGQQVNLPPYPFQRERCWVPGTRQAFLPKQQTRNAKSEENKELYYSVKWQEKESPKLEGKEQKPVHWLVFADKGNFCESLMEQLKKTGNPCSLVYSGVKFSIRQEEDMTLYSVSPLQKEDFQQLFNTIREEDKAPNIRIIHLWSLGLPDYAQTTPELLEQSQNVGVGSIMLLLQALDSLDLSKSPDIWLLTQGAQVIGDQDNISPAQTPLWGFGRALIAEMPNINTVLVDIDSLASPNKNAVHLITEINNTSNEQQLAFRNGKTWVPRLHRAEKSIRRQLPVKIHANASYLITGGLGDLGLVIAKQLAERGARQLILVNRTKVPPRSTWLQMRETDPHFQKVKALLGLEEMGVAVQLSSFNIADEKQLGAFFEDHQRSGLPDIRGVIHTAGVAGGSIVSNLDKETLQKVWQPKVTGGWLLHRLFAQQPLDFFTVFSAIPSVLGWLGQGASAYAAANAFLDVLVHCKPFYCKRSTSMIWGPWNSVGMASREKGGLKKLGHFGVKGISPEIGATIFDSVLQGKEPNPIIVDIDWPLFGQNFYKADQSPFLQHIIQQPVSKADTILPEKRQPSIQNSLAQKANSKERYLLIEAHFQEGLARILHLPANQVDVHQPIIEMGVDSLMALEMKTHIQINMGISIPLLAFLKNPSLAQVAQQALTLYEDILTGKNEKVIITGEPGKEATFPLSHGQRALWFLYRLAPKNAAYNVLLAFKINERLNIPALQLSFQKLNQRHETLRTLIKHEQGKPVSQVLDFLPVEFSLKHVPNLSQEQIAEELFAASDAPFDLENGPVYRVNLFVKSETEYHLLLTFHHISIDLWSLDILLKELKTLYAAEIKGKEVALVPIRFQYKDFVTWQEGMLSSPEGAQHWQYWQKQLSGELPVLDLPFSKPRMPIQSFNGQLYQHALSPLLARPFKKLAKTEGVTPYIAFLAAFKSLISRYTGLEEILLGSPMLGRNSPEFEKTAGYFTNPVALRTSLAGSPSFRIALKRVRETVLGAIAHQDFPFSLLVEKLQPIRDPSYSPIFQIAFFWDKVLLFETDGTKDLNKNKLNLEPLFMKQRGAPFDLTLTVVEKGRKLSLNWQYNTDLFDLSVICRMAEHFQVLLKNVVAQPDLAIAQLPLLGKEEQQLLYTWNQTTATYPANLCIHQLFELQAQTSPDHIAIEQENRQLTYRELNQKANQFARHLIEIGVKNGTLVGVFAQRSIEVVISILGILKTGGAYVPIDPVTPLPRIQFMIEESSMSVLVTQVNMGKNLESPQVQLFFMDKNWTQLNRYATENLSKDISSRELAYVMFTSGSTGKPKGVQIEHRSVINLLYSVKEKTDFQQWDALFSVTTFSFDISVLELFLPLIWGAKTILCSREVAMNGLLLAEKLDKLAPSFMQATPATWQLLIEAGWKGNASMKIVCGGEALPAALAQNLKDRCHTVWNVYGPTETTIWSTLHKIGDVGTSIPIGKPLANTQVYVLDPNKQPVPIGGNGELYIGGDGLARAYLGNPKLTAEKFVQNQFSSKPGSRLYRTGDLVKLLPSGDLIFLGRLDHQVKINGYRIELGEIEAILSEHPDVSENVLVATESKPQVKRLVAYIVRQNETGKEPVTDNDLRNFLKEQLPDYMVPSFYVFLDALPLTQNGKIDREALPQFQRDEKTNWEPPIAPRTSTEKALTEIWKDVLGIQSVGVNNNFFDLGGASVQSLQVTERGKKVGLPIVPEFLFEFQTIALLAARIDKEMLLPETEKNARENSSPSTVPLDTITREDFTGLPTSLGSNTEKCTTLIESLGVYLPSTVVSTDQVMNGCKHKMNFPLERMTGIKNRRFADTKEFSIDLAKKAVQNCLAKSKYMPHQIDLLICCNISRYDAPYQFSFEPNTSSKLRYHFGMDHALAFDISNACTGMFTAIHVANAYIKAGIVENAMIVSGEYISHLTQTAQREIEGFMDARLACLTLGDAGAALILEKSTDSHLGFQELDLYTLGKYSSLCIAKITDHEEGGAIMLTDPIKQTEVSIHHAVKHSQKILKKGNWNPESFQHIIMHQTSQTALNDAVRAINNLYDKEICTPSNTVMNLEERGNTATTTHFVALHDFIMKDRINSGEKIVFAITGSGQTIGTALYTMDDLPDRLRKNGWAAPTKNINGTMKNNYAWTAKKGRIKVESVGLLAEGNTIERNMVALATAAAGEVINKSSIDRQDIDLLIYAGVYRNEFLSEPAVAALVAGSLKLNDDIAAATEKRTFVFDVLNGALGFLNACHVAIQLMQAEKFEHAMVVTAEIENNALVYPDNLRGLKETGSAVLLTKDAQGTVGFGSFAFKQYKEQAEAVVTNSQYDGKRIYLDMKIDDRIEDLFLDGLEDGVAEVLHSEGLDISDIDLVLPSQLSPDFVAKLAKKLNVGEEKVINIAQEGADYFTSSMAYCLGYIQENKLAISGKIGLVINVGSGGQVGCAIYYF